MALVSEVADHDGLVAAIRKDREGWPDQGDVTADAVRVIPYFGIDPRIGWDTWLVTVHGSAVGFTDGPLVPRPVFICPLCRRRSYHPMDIREHFCGKCGFVDDVIETLLTRRQ